MATNKDPSGQIADKANSSVKKIEWQTDLVITRDYTFNDSFSNRWEFVEANDLVDYNYIMNWQDAMLKTIYPELQRVKIRIELSALINLNRFLRHLSISSPKLKYLEVDRLKLTSKVLILEFPSLQTLLLNSIVAALGTQVRFKARVLERICLGKYRLFFLFSSTEC